MSERVELGRISGVWGTAGWVKVYSLTSPPENIFEYQPWRTERSPGRLRVREWRRQGPRLMARLAGIDTRDAAEALVGATLHIDRDELPEPEHQRFYWHDLVGLDVVDAAGTALGRVGGMMDTGAHDVMQVEPGEGATPMLVPFVMERYVLEVDLSAGRIVVDWDPAWLADSGAE